LMMAKCRALFDAGKLTLDAVEAAELIGSTPYLIRRLVKVGLLPTPISMDGKQITFSSAAWLEYFEKIGEPEVRAVDVHDPAGHLPDLYVVPRAPFAKLHYQLGIWRNEKRDAVVKTQRRQRRTGERARKGRSDKGKARGPSMKNILEAEPGKLDEL